MTPGTTLFILEGGAGKRPVGFSRNIRSNQERVNKIGAVKIALIGTTGQLGSDLQSLLSSKQRGLELGLAASGRAELDVCDQLRVDEFVKRSAADVVISTAAYNRVDDCEMEPETAFAVNAIGSRNLASACARHNAALVWFSTDFVFDGASAAGYLEEDRTAPLNIYGCSKAAGELVLRASLERHIIIRSSSLYGVAGSSGKAGNFVEHILAGLRAGQELRVVDDLVMSPTYTRDLALATLDIILSGAFGTFHAANSGACSWHEFACEIARQAGYDNALIHRQSVTDLGGARRPPHSVLSSSRRPPMRRWQEALTDYLAQRADKAIFR